MHHSALQATVSYDIDTRVFYISRNAIRKCYLNNDFDT